MGPQPGDNCETIFVSVGILQPQPNKTQKKGKRSKKGTFGSLRLTLLNLISALGLVKL